MLSRVFVAELKWVTLAMFITFFLTILINSGITFYGTNDNLRNTFLGLNLFLEILVFFVFSIFVVFGIKGFFEKYSQKTTNVILFITGGILTLVIIILTCQILF